MDPKALGILPVTTAALPAELERTILAACRKPLHRAWLLAFLADPERNATKCLRAVGATGTDLGLQTRAQRLKKLYLHLVEQYDMAAVDAGVVNAREVQTLLAELARSKEVADRDRLKALELIARIHGMLVDSVKIDTKLDWRMELVNNHQHLHAGSEPKALASIAPIEVEILHASQEEKPKVLPAGDGKRSDSAR